MTEDELEYKQKQQQLLVAFFDEYDTGRMFNVPYYEHQNPFMFAIINAARKQMESKPKRKTDYELVQDVMRNLEYSIALSHQIQPRWAHVRDIFGTGSTSAKALCVEFGYDPETRM